MPMIRLAFITLLLLLISCTESEDVTELRLKHKEQLGVMNDSILVKNIEILEEIELSTQQMAMDERERLLKLNDQITYLLNNYHYELKYEYETNIMNRKILSQGIRQEERLPYLNANKSDSVKLEEVLEEMKDLMTQRSSNNEKLVIIDSLCRLWNDTTTSRLLVHIIEYDYLGVPYTDTLIYRNFVNGTLWYFNDAIDIH